MINFRYIILLFANKQWGNPKNYDDMLGRIVNSNFPISFTTTCYGILLTIKANPNDERSYSGAVFVRDIKSDSFSYKESEWGNGTEQSLKVFYLTLGK